MNLTQIKTATQAAIRRVGGVEAAASCTRVGKTQISEYQNRNAAAVVPLDVAAVLDEYAQEPLILSALATIEGYTLLPIDFGEGCAASSMAQVASTVGDTMNATMLALADGKIEQHEAIDLAHRLNNVIRVSSAALQNMQRLAYPEKTEESPANDAAARRPRGAR